MPRHNDSAPTRDAELLTLREARERFFAENQATLGKDGGYDVKWVRIEFWRIPLFLPNLLGRDRAVRLHDLHHLLTGYQTDLAGEAEIGAWEVASGCRDFWFAWVLNMWAFTLGLLLAPRRTFRAFVRGRRCDNFYQHYTRLEDSLLEETVGHARTRLRLLQPVGPTTGRDVAAFLGWALLSALLTLLPGALPLAAALAVVLYVF